MKKIYLIITIGICVLLGCYCIFNKISVNRVQHQGDFFSGKVILLCGDSRSSEDYTFYKDILEAKTGATVYVKGLSGATAEDNAKDEYTRIFAEYPHDYCIALFGGNDTGERGTVGTFSDDTVNAMDGEPLVSETDISDEYDGTMFIQALSHIIRKWKYECYDWRISANLNGYESEEEKEKILDMQRKPVFILCTDIPQQRESRGSPWSLEENIIRKNNAIKECAEKYNVEILDLYDLCNFDMSFEPVFNPPTNMEQNNGIYYMDGLHLNKYGIDVITSLEVQKLRQYEKMY